MAFTLQAYSFNALLTQFMFVFPLPETLSEPSLLHPSSKESADFPVKSQSAVSMWQHDRKKVERNTIAYSFRSPLHRTQKHEGVPEPRRTEQHLRGHVPRRARRRSAPLRRPLRHHDAGASQRHGHHAGVEENERGGSLHSHAQRHHGQQVKHTYTHAHTHAHARWVSVILSRYRHEGK